MGQASPHNGGIHPSSRSDARCYLIHIVVTGAHVHVAAEPQSDGRAGRLSQRWLPVRAHLRVYTTPPRCLIPMWCCSDIQVPDWMTAVSRVGISLPQLVGVSADHQCIVWCHQGVAHMSQVLRHLAASDGQTRAEAGVRYRDEALQTWFSPSKERSAARHHAATAAPVVIASLLALPALCLMRVFVCAAAGAPRGAEVLPSIALLGCSGLRSVVTCAPPGPLLVAAALLVARLCGIILGDALVDAVAWASKRLLANSKRRPPLVGIAALECAVLVTGAPVMGTWLLGAHLLFTVARHSRLCAQLAVAYGWAVVCAAPAAGAWAQACASGASWRSFAVSLTSRLSTQVVLAQGWPHRPRSSHADAVLAIAALAGALRVVRNAWESSRAGLTTPNPCPSSRLRRVAVIPPCRRSPHCARHACAPPVPRGPCLWRCLWQPWQPAQASRLHAARRRECPCIGSRSKRPSLRVLATMSSGGVTSTWLQSSLWPLREVAWMVAAPVCSSNWCSLASTISSLPTVTGSL